MHAAQQADAAPTYGHLRDFKQTHALIDAPPSAIRPACSPQRRGRHFDATRARHAAVHAEMTGFFLRLQASDYLHAFCLYVVTPTSISATLTRAQYIRPVSDARFSRSMPIGRAKNESLLSADDAAAKLQIFPCRQPPGLPPDKPSIFSCRMSRSMTPFRLAKRNARLGAALPSRKELLADMFCLRTAVDPLAKAPHKSPALYD